MFAANPQSEHNLIFSRLSLPRNVTSNGEGQQGSGPSKQTFFLLNLIILNGNAGVVPSLQICFYVDQRSIKLLMAEFK